MTTPPSTNRLVRPSRSHVIRLASALAGTALAAVIGLGATPAGAAPLESAVDPLAAWVAALESAGTEPADVLFLGDSISQGYGAPTRADWFVETVRQELQSSWGGTGTGYRAAWPTFWADDAPAWSLTGGRSDETAGLGLRAHRLDSATAEVAVTVQADSFRLLYATGPGAGVMEIAIDGTVVAQVDTNAVVAATGQAWLADALGAGPHTVQIRPVSTGGAPVRPVVVEGILDGDTESGVRVWDASHAGYGSTHYVAQRAWQAGVSQADPELVVIELGTNDYVFQLTGTEFEANLAAIVDGVQAAATGPVSIALLPMYLGEGRDPSRYAPYVEAQERLAGSRGLALIDLSDTDASLLTDDGVHPHAVGQRVLATSVLAAADPRFQAPPLPAAVTELVVEPGVQPGTLAASWAASASSERYVVRLADSTGRVIGEISQTGATASFSGLTPGANHTVSVFAGNAAGFATATSATSAAAGALVVAPADPTDLVATYAAATGAIEVTWTAPAGPVTDYAVLAYDTVTGYLSTQTVTGTSATFANLPAGRSYIFGVYAHNTVGYSPGAASNVVAVPVRVVAPTAPTTVVATHTPTTGATTVTWTAPAGTVTDYLVQAYDTVTGYVTSQTVTTTTATFSTLPTGRSYVFAVYAHNAGGYSPSAGSNAVAVPAKATAPAAPTNVVAATTTAKGTVKVTWTAPAGTVTSYVVTAYDTLTGIVGTKTVTTPTATFTGLRAGRTYVVTVQARNSVGTSSAATSNQVKVLR